MLTNKELDELFSIDKDEMYAHLVDFYTQLDFAISLSAEFDFDIAKYNKSKVLIMGMGGSAIAGNIIANYFASSEKLKNIQIIVNRSYDVPAFVDSDWLIIASSYSGNTEETISGLNQAEKISDAIICLATGGKLKEIANEKGYLFIELQSGMMPRIALGYSLFTQLMLFSKIYNTGIIADLSEIREQLIENSQKYADPNAICSPYSEAKKLIGKIPLIIATDSVNDGIAMRLQAQIQENAKQAAFVSLLPEMNHNQINGFAYPIGIQQQIFVIILRSPNESQRIAARIIATKEVLESENIEYIEVFGKGNTVLQSMIDLIYWGDWLSYYLALLNNADPTPIPLIMKLKEILAK